MRAHAAFHESAFKLTPISPVDGASTFWEKLAMTPVTLALDCTLFLPINLLGFWLNDAANAERRTRRKQG